MEHEHEIDEVEITAFGDLRRTVIQVCRDISCTYTNGPLDRGPVEPVDAVRQAGYPRTK